MTWIRPTKTVGTLSDVKEREESIKVEELLLRELESLPFGFDGGKVEVKAEADRKGRKA